MAGQICFPELLYLETEQPIATIGAICRVDGDPNLHLLTSSAGFVMERSRGVRVSRDVYTRGSDAPISTEMIVHDDLALLRTSKKSLESELKGACSQVALGSKDAKTFTVNSSNAVKSKDTVQLLTSLGNAQYGRVRAVGFKFQAEEGKWLDNTIVIEELNPGNDFAHPHERGALVVAEVDKANQQNVVAIVVFTQQLNLILGDKSTVLNATIALPFSDVLQNLSVAGREVKISLEDMNRLQFITSSTKDRATTCPAVIPAFSKQKRAFDDFELFPNQLTGPEPNIPSSTKVEATEPKRTFDDIGLVPNEDQLTEPQHERTGPEPTRTDDPEQTNNPQTRGRSLGLSVGPKGGNFKMPSLGVEIRIPPGAVDNTIALIVSIPNDEHDLSWQLQPLSPHIRIEPEDVQYQKPIRVLMDHSLLRMQNVKNDSKPPLLLYRHTSNEPWEIIKTQDPMKKVEEFCKESTLQICQDDKFGFVYDSYVAVEMSTNCDLCLVEHVDSRTGRSEQGRRVGLEVYASFSEAGVEMRVYVTHGINSRRTAVQQIEDRILGSYLGCGTLLLDPKTMSKNVIIASTHTYSDGIGERVQRKEVYMTYLREEWSTNPDVPPYCTFILPHSVGGDPTVKVTIDAEHGTFRAMPIDFLRKLSQIGTISTRLDLDRPDRCIEVPWDQSRQRLIDILRTMPWEDIRSIGSNLGILDESSSEQISQAQLTKSICEMLADRKEIVDIIRFLGDLKIVNEDLRQRLSSLNAGASGSS